MIVALLYGIGVGAFLVYYWKDATTYAKPGERGWTYTFGRKGLSLLRGLSLLSLVAFLWPAMLIVAFVVVLIDMFKERRAAKRQERVK